MPDQSKKSDSKSQSTSLAAREDGSVDPAVKQGEDRTARAQASTDKPAKGGLKSLPKDAKVVDPTEYEIPPEAATHVQILDPHGLHPADIIPESDAPREGAIDVRTPQDAYRSKDNILKP